MITPEVKISNLANFTDDDQKFEFTIEQKNLQKLLRILTSDLYKNKPGAVIRELSTNCLDAHRSINNKEPFLIIEPSSFNNNILTIRDFGPGLDKDEIENIYTRYLESTKENTNEQTGCLGLGSKSPFSISESFTVTSYKNNKITQYLMRLNEKKIPECVVLNDLEPTLMESKIFQFKYDEYIWYKSFMVGKIGFDGNFRLGFLIRSIKQYFDMKNELMLKITLIDDKNQNIDKYLKMYIKEDDNKNKTFFDLLTFEILNKDLEIEKHDIDIYNDVDVTELKSEEEIQNYNNGFKFFNIPLFDIFKIKDFNGYFIEIVRDDNISREENNTIVEDDLINYNTYYDYSYKSGLKIEIPINEKIKDSIIFEIQNQLLCFPIIPKVLIKNKNGIKEKKIPNLYSEENKKYVEKINNFNIFNTKSIDFSLANKNGFFLIQGGVYYEIEVDLVFQTISSSSKYNSNINLDYFEIFKKLVEYTGQRNYHDYNMFLEFDIGEINFNPSRENLNYDLITCTKIYNSFVDFFKNLENYILEDLKKSENSFIFSLKYYKHKTVNNNNIINNNNNNNNNPISYLSNGNNKGIIHVLKFSIMNSNNFINKLDSIFANFNIDLTILENDEKNKIISNLINFENLFDNFITKFKPLNEIRNLSIQKRFQDLSNIPLYKYSSKSSNVTEIIYPKTLFNSLKNQYVLNIFFLKSGKFIKSEYTSLIKSYFNKLSTQIFNYKNNIQNFDEKTNTIPIAKFFSSTGIFEATNNNDLGLDVNEQYLDSYFRNRSVIIMKDYLNKNITKDDFYEIFGYKNYKDIILNSDCPVIPLIVDLDEELKENKIKEIKKERKKPSIRFDGIGYKYLKQANKKEDFYDINSFVQNLKAKKFSKLSELTVTKKTIGDLVNKIKNNDFIIIPYNNLGKKIESLVLDELNFNWVPHYGSEHGMISDMNKFYLSRSFFNYIKIKYNKDILFIKDKFINDNNLKSYCLNYKNNFMKVFDEFNKDLDNSVFYISELYDICLPMNQHDYLPLDTFINSSVISKENNGKNFELVYDVENNKKKLNIPDTLFTFLNNAKKLYKSCIQDQPNGYQIEDLKTEKDQLFDIDFSRFNYILRYRDSYLIYKYYYDQSIMIPLETYISEIKTKVKIYSFYTKYNFDFSVFKKFPQLILFFNVFNLFHKNFNSNIYINRDLKILQKLWNNVLKENFDNLGIFAFFISANEITFEKAQKISNSLSERKHKKIVKKILLKKIFEKEFKDKKLEINSSTNLKFKKPLLNERHLEEVSDSQVLNY